ncbi:MAG: DUF4118 domain-containing protein [Erysipelotrichia bacterium]|nr:DUF4118 domain-containing protein [Erysipelotrichia bacterium]NCC54911.1 DUF4118 domain-containing protein [Erysipelotrichia bacterium]
MKLDTNKRKDTFKMIIILSLCTMIASIFFALHLHTENIMIVYLTGVLLVIIENRRFFWGVVASLLSIILFNFLFTTPRFSLAMDDPNYFVTIFIFFIVSFFVSTLTSKLQRTLQISKQKEIQTQILYENSRTFLQISGLENIILYGIKTVNQILKQECIIYLSNESDDSVLSAPYYDDTMKHKKEIENASSAIWCYQNMIECGKGSSFFSDSKWLYLPLQSPRQILGVVALYVENEKESNRLVVDTLLSQIALAIEKEKLSMIQEKNLIEIEKEKLRNTLLRSISHDLRTPLTNISGSSSFIVNSYDKLHKNEIISLIKDIGNDAVWLNNMVENLLNMTRLQEDNLHLNKQKEVVDDIMEDVINRLPKHYRSHIHLDLPTVFLVEVDGKLFIQVLVNIVDNAFKHTKENVDVFIKVYTKEDTIIFEISDTGGGISEQILPKIFDRFESESKGISADSYRGTGLGLSIAKEVILAHGGTICAFNNDIGGATFKIELAQTEEQNERKH